MCTVSNIGNYGAGTIPQRYPWIDPNPTIPWQPQVPSQYEFDKLKKEVEELKKLLQAAKHFDDRTGQHDCEVEDKVAFLKKIAEFVGVDLADVFDSPKKSKHLKKIKSPFE